MAPKRRAATLAPQGPSPAAADQGVPFSPDVQAHIFRMLLEDPPLGDAVAQSCGVEFFTVDPLKWFWWQALVYRQTYGRFPSMLVLRDLASRMPATHANLYVGYLDWIRNLPRADLEWLRDQAIDFVKKVVFRKAIIDSRDLHNAGKWIEAYDLMRERMGAIEAVTFTKVDREWLAEGFVERVARRSDVSTTDVIGTGFPKFDKLLGGGAEPGFFGLWQARAKKGKTTLLINLGAVAMRVYAKKVVHFTLETSTGLIAARYDSIFTGELYSLVKKGDIDAKKYASAAAELSHLRGYGLVRSLIGYNTTILDVDRELRELEQGFNFIPDVVVLDYIDLLKPRVPIENETRSQIAATQDFSTLVKQGEFVGWSASQGNRPPKNDLDEDPVLLTQADVADAYGKVRIPDFFGSLNQTKQEREQKMARLYIELVRDGPSNEIIHIKADFDHMSMSPIADDKIPDGVKNAALMKPGKLLNPAYVPGKVHA
jgi:replicative DNA helicase